MKIDLSNNDQVNELLIIGIPVPEERSGFMELSPEEEIIIFRDKFMTTKGDVLASIRIKHTHMSHYPMSAVRMGLNPDTALEILDRMTAIVKQSPWNIAPEGFWHFQVRVSNGALMLMLLNEKGHFNEELQFVADEPADEFVLYSVDGNADFAEDTFYSLYCLPEKQRMIVELRYGLLDGESRTTKEIQELLGISSEEEVLKLEKNAMETIRNNK